MPEKSRQNGGIKVENFHQGEQMENKWELKGGQKEDNVHQRKETNKDKEKKQKKVYIYSW